MDEIEKFNDDTQKILVFDRDETVNQDPKELYFQTLKSALDQDIVSVIK
jgi:histidinol phosphatase-like enzyme